MDDGCLGAERCLDEIRPDYDRAASSGRAVGLGLGLKNSGLGNGFKEHIRAVVRFVEDGTVEVRHCWTEMGQGVHTVALQVAVRSWGSTRTQVRVITDTTRELGAGQTTGSRGTLMGAGAVADACRAAKADGCRVGVDYEGEYRVDWTHHLGEVEQPVIHSTFGYAAQLVVMDPETQAIEEVVAVHDVGRAVNPLLCEGQIEGSVHMGLGYALTEDFPADAETGHPDEHDAPLARHPAGQGRAAHAGAARRVPAAPMRPTASRASARSASCPRRRRWPPRSTPPTGCGARSSR